MPSLFPTALKFALPPAKSRPKSAYATQVIHAPSPLSPPTSVPAPANASRSTPHPSEMSTSPKRTSMPTHAEDENYMCFKNHLAPARSSFPCCVVGLRVKRGRTLRTPIDLNMILERMRLIIITRLDAANVHTHCPYHSKRYNVRTLQSII